MTRLVTVHGTGAGADADKGDIWWQDGSPFMTRLGQLIDLSRVDIDRFHWGVGSNSESERRKAAIALYQRLAQFDAAGEDYYLIGHSHGGSVVYSALQYSIQCGKPLHRLQAWCTVGAPFIDIAPRRFLFSRLNAPGLAVYILGLLLVLAAVGFVVAHFTGAPVLKLLDERLGGAAIQQVYLPLVAGACLLSFCTFAFLYWYEWIGNRWMSDRLKRRIAERYAGSWIGLVHEDDEALAALRGASDFKPEIVPRNFLKQPFAMIPVLALTAVMLLLIFSLESSLYLPIEKLKTFAEALAKVDARSFSISLPGVYGLLTWSIVILVIFALTTATVYASKLLGAVLGRPLASSIDRLVWASVREQIWGDDIAAERVRGVSSHPPSFALRYRPLPPAVAAPVQALADSSASDTLRRLRSNLGMATSRNRSADLFGTALSLLSWREMVHTCYFDVEEFTRLVAFALHRKGLAALKTDAWTAADRTAARESLRAMTIAAPENAGDVERVGIGRATSQDASLNLSVRQKTLVSVGIVLALFAAGFALTTLVVSPHWAAAIWVGGALLLLVVAEAVPVSIGGLHSVRAPATGFEEAKARFTTIAAVPEHTLHPRCTAHIMDHGRRVPRAYVLVHGISNCPYSMVDFAPQLHRLGHNVLVARMPWNGHLDNATDALRHITAEELRKFADECIDVAAGLGERVHVIGISAGGVIAGWMAQNRPEIDRAVLVAPAYGLSSFGTGLNTALLRLILFVPNFSVWKDPIKRAAAESRPHSYKRMSTRGMGEVMRLGFATKRQADRERAGARAITLVMNAADAAVDPALPDDLARKWERKAVPVTRFTFPKELALPHEMIDPTEDGANVGVSYPKLLELAERPPEVPAGAHPTAAPPVAAIGEIHRAASG
jgi:alpha-beta hydrolase superfamily lysophospholipase